MSYGSAKPSSNNGLTQREFNLPNFDSLSFDLPADVTLAASDSFRLQSVGPESLNANLDVSVTDGVLNVALKGESSLSSPLAIDISLPSVSAVTAKSATVVHSADTLPVSSEGDLHLSVSDDAWIDLTLHSTEKNVVSRMAGRGSIPEALVFQEETDKQVWYGDNFCSSTTNYDGRGRGSSGGGVWYGDNYGCRTVNYYGRRLQGQEAVTDSRAAPNTNQVVDAETLAASPENPTPASAEEEELEKQTWYGDNRGYVEENIYGGDYNPGCCQRNPRGSCCRAIRGRHLQETWIGNNIDGTVTVNGPGQLNWQGRSYAGGTVTYMPPTSSGTPVTYMPVPSTDGAPTNGSTPTTTTVTHTSSATTTISVPQGSYAPIQTSPGVMIGDNGPGSSIMQDFSLPGSAPAAPVTAVAPATGAAASTVLLAPAPAVAYPARPATAPINPMMMPYCQRNLMGSCCTALNGRRLQEEEGAEGVVVPNEIPATTPEMLAETETGAPAEVQVVDPPVETPVDEMDKQVWYGDNFCSSTTNYHSRGCGSGGGGV
uniref:Putative auto-transporter adhesin head GIN domain-containing protein n=1 Tax=Chromera velia CCMP2878 TaxID=1169474 RepID=A0A0G4I8M4_9ALVE|eukprot:Cvel_11986.t1-p1 / transcript=Cvel_11986.t1 / gene=Cvel_11986 / organism=Chromera_velia_CCMP2878 / gene_product=hypothetical protein / transcript_product=hypothetical protein / location=Cvel_scaffold768:61458-65874(+) / protein_length=542 / sequence_SO=supercontig / SO=protein_coding / is_pseudo=false